MSNVIYEHARYPLPPQAKFLGRANDDVAIWLKSEAQVFPSGFAPDFYKRDVSELEQSGEVRRRLVRVSDPEYYVEENPYTDSYGRISKNIRVFAAQLNPSQEVRIWYMDGDLERIESCKVKDVIWLHINAFKVKPRVKFKPQIEVSPAESVRVKARELKPTSHNSIVYEHPDHPVDEQAEFLALTFFGQPVWRRDSIGAIADNFAPDCYRAELRRNEGWRKLIRLSDPEYYVPENPHTDDEGFLKHDGGKMPEWVRGKTTQLRWRDGMKSEVRPADQWLWVGADHAYRIIDVVKTANKVLCETIEKLAADSLRRMADDLLRDMLESKPELHRTNKLRQQRRVVAVGDYRVRDSVLQQYWESEDGEHGEWRDVPAWSGD